MDKKLGRIAVATAAVLLVPLVAMQFSAQVAWSWGDFVIAGVLLFGAGATYELVARRGKTIVYRTAVGVAVAAGLLLLWVNGAVGIIGNEGNPANLLYGGVLAVAILGAGLARLRPRGMTRTLFAAAIAQLLVPLIAILIWTPTLDWGSLGMAGVLVFNFFFAVLWAASGLLFQRAAVAA